MNLTMLPLRIAATLTEGLFLPSLMLHLDGVLAAAWADIQGLPKPGMDGELVKIEIPLQREPEGRFHLASCFIPQFVVSETQFTNRRPVIEAAQRFGGPKLTRLDMATGVNKAYRVARSVGIPAAREVHAYCIGDKAHVEQLLAHVTHLGKRRAVGLGQVRRWRVEVMQPDDLWDGFPVLSREGFALRPLPLDYPGLVVGRVEDMGLTYPYWDKKQWGMVALPEVVYG